MYDMCTVYLSPGIHKIWKISSLLHLFEEEDALPGLVPKLSFDAAGDVSRWWAEKRNKAQLISWFMPSRMLLHFGILDIISCFFFEHPIMGMGIPLIFLMDFPGS